MNESIKRRARAASAIHTMVSKNPETAEYADRIVIAPKGTEAQRWSAESRRKLTQHARENDGFVMAFFPRVDKLRERFNVDGHNFTPEDLARLMYIGTYIAYGSGILQHSNGRRMTVECLSKICGLSRQRFAAFYGKLTGAGIINVEHDGWLRVSETEFFRGDMATIRDAVAGYQYVQMYRRAIRELYRQYGSRNLSRVALIYEILPFLNFATNMLCENPDEADNELLMPLTLDRLADKLGRNTKKLKPAMTAVKLGGKPVFAFLEDVHDGRKRRVIVNPAVVFGGNGYELEAVKAYFN